MNNPFKEGTQRYEVFEILKDSKWHCTKCELHAAQAATFRDMKKTCETIRVFRKIKI